MTAPVFTPNMNLGLPVPGYTGALGVELPNYSWMELQNAAMVLIDQHDHSSGKGVPVSSLGVSVVADFTFSGHAPLNTRGIGLADQTGNVPSDVGFLYRLGVDLYYKNGSGAAVQVTSGTGVNAAPGNITGFPSGTASLLYAAGSFTFYQATNQRATLYGGPLSIADPVVNGKAVLISAPSGLGANYSLTLPAALPGVAAIMTMSATGVIGASTDVTDNSTLQQSAGVLSIKNSGVGTGQIANDAVTTAKILNLNVTTAKIADANVTAVKLSAPNVTFSASSGTFSRNALGAFTILTGGQITNSTGRTNVITIESDGSANLARHYATNSSVSDSLTILIKRDGTTIATFSILSPSPGNQSDGPTLFVVTDANVAAGAHTYTMETAGSTYNTTVYRAYYMRLVTREV